MGYQTAYTVLYDMKSNSMSAPNMVNISVETPIAAAQWVLDKKCMSNTDYQFLVVKSDTFEVVGTYKWHVPTRKRIMEEQILNQ